MRSFSLSTGALALAGIHTVSLAAPSTAFAQAAQPIPYNTAPVPYGQPGGTTPAQPAARPALAPPAPGSDVIYLKNGGILRGTIIDAIPNASARIQLATGEIATVPWSEVARFEHGAAAPPAPAPAQPPAAQQPRRIDALATGGAVIVHIDSPSPVELQRRGDQSIALPRGRSAAVWETVCSSPCDKPIPAQGQYRIVGDGARPSREFGLPGMSGPVAMSVSPASSGWFVGGIVLTGVGGLAMLSGLVVALVAAVATNLDHSGTAQDWETGGWTTFGLGAAGMILGIVAFSGNARTGVEFGRTESSGRAGESPWAHVASWREPRQERPNAPATVAVPLFSGSF